MAKQYHCILIDDELLALSYLRTLCEAIPSVHVVKAYDRPEQLLLDLPHLSFDFCISDIVMPGMNGLELASRLSGKPVIFTTAHNEFAADAFDVDAVDYLRKPVQKQRLEKAIEKVIQLFEAAVTKPVSIRVTTNKGKMLLDSRQIVAISSETIDRRDKLVTLVSGEHWVLKNISFDELLRQLPEAQFCRISKSEALALSLIKGYSGETIFTTATDKNGNPLSFILGDNYRKNFLERLG